MFDFNALFDAITEDYKKFNTGKDGKLTEYGEKTVPAFRANLTISDPKTKYIRIVAENGTPNARVWGFVVNTHDDKKFKYGDILKAAGWKAPAKNFARGSMLNPETFKNFRWTGAM